MPVADPSEPVLPEGSFIDVSSSTSLNFSFVASLLYNSAPGTVTKELSIGELVGDEYANTGKAKDPTESTREATEVTPGFPSGEG